MRYGDTAWERRSDHTTMETFRGGDKDGQDILIAVTTFNGNFV